KVEFLHISTVENDFPPQFPQKNCKIWIASSLLIISSHCCVVNKGAECRIYISKLHLRFVKIGRGTPSKEQPKKEECTIYRHGRAYFSSILRVYLSFL